MEARCRSRGRIVARFEKKTCVKVASSSCGAPDIFTPGAVVNSVIAGREEEGQILALDPQDSQCLLDRLVQRPEAWEQIS